MIFQEETKANKRVLIALDVLARLKKGNYIARSRVWAKIPVRREEVENKLQVCDILDKKVCECCALGSILLSEIAFNNHYELNGYNYNEKGATLYIDLDEREEELKKIFSNVQLVLIEIAFEGGNGCYNFNSLSNDNRERYYDKAVSFYNKYSDADERLEAIMNNIVENKGTFKP